MGFVGVGAETFVAVFLIGLEVAFEEYNLGFTFKSQYVSGEAVEEIAVVANDDGTAGEVLQGFFQ